MFMIRPIFYLHSFSNGMCNWCKSWKWTFTSNIEKKQVWPTVFQGNFICNSRGIPKGFNSMFDTYELYWVDSKTINSSVIYQLLPIKNEKCGSNVRTKQNHFWNQWNSADKKNTELLSLIELLLLIIYIANTNLCCVCCFLFVPFPINCVHLKQI